ncbi:MAG: beta-lactamase family protein [Gemmatimonadota bacterium]|nr:beta-lactamase family protein [Gemmatimonadota bacterium]
MIVELMKGAIVPGLSIAVIKDSELVWKRGFGVKDSISGGNVDDDTVFDVASVSKTVFAYAVMKLCEKGVIGLDTPLTRYTPDRILEGDARLDRITARHVLSHTSGFQNWRSGREPLRIHFEPGEKYLYSGEGYFYLQSVVTHLTGQRNPNLCAPYEADLEVCATDIDTYLTANLLRPFGMASSGYPWNDSLNRRAARPHDVAGKPLAKGKPTATGPARYAAAGGLHTTATDYARFLLEIMDPRPSDAFRLSKASLQTMIRPHVKVDESTSWALGWQVGHTPGGDLIQHQGGQGGFQAFTAASVERRSGFVMLTNSANGSKVFYDERFSAAMNRVLFGGR